MEDGCPAHYRGRAENHLLFAIEVPHRALTNHQWNGRTALLNTTATDTLIVIGRVYYHGVIILPRQCETKKTSTTVLPGPILHILRWHFPR